MSAKKLAVMFNERQKQEYLAFENHNSTAIARYFLRIGPFEEEKKKDIADMNSEELRETISALNIRREESRAHFISLIRGYINWAMLYGKTENKSAINSITAESIDSQKVIRQRMIKDPEQLEAELNKTLDDENYHNRSAKTRLIIWLAYCGVPLEDLPDLKKTDIDYDNNTVTTQDGCQYIINAKVSELWNQCATMTYIEKKNGKSNNARKKDVEEYTQYNLVDSDYLFRPIVGNNPLRDRKCPLSTFRAIVSNAFSNKIPARNLRYSGMFYRIHLLETDGIEITPEVFAEYFDIEYKDQTELLLKTRKWRIDYEDWKLAFDYM